MPVLRTLTLALLLLISAAVQATNVAVKGLFAGSAVLSINGQQRLLKVGSTSPEGVKLIRADSRIAVLEIDGVRHQLGISQHIASGFVGAKRSEVRLQESSGGHYWATGQINGHPIRFLVDTGATNIAMNRITAERLGLNFRAGREAKARTAGGIVPIFLVQLARVSVGGIVLDNVQASVHLDESPSQVLLGNSFLSQLEIQKDNGVLVLSSQR